MQPDRTTVRQVLGLLVAMLIAGIATLAARRLHWPDMLVAPGLGLLLAPTLRGARWSAGLAALGLLTRTGSLLRLGWRPVVLMIALTLVIAVVAALGVST